MNRKENALRILNFDHPERVTSDLPAHRVSYLGCHHEAYDSTGERSPVGTRWTDIWGIGWEKKQEGIMGYPVFHPLAEPESFKSYRWPDPDDERICGRIYSGAKTGREPDTFLLGAHRNLLFEKVNKLMGMENLMVYFHTEPGFVREVFRGYMDFQLRIARHYLECGVEAVELSEDLGAQTATLLSPQIVDEFLVPEYQRLFLVYNERGVIIKLHSCGHVEPLLDTFIRLGVRMLNPLQVTANNLDMVRSRTQGKMALQGGIRSTTVRNGPVEKIRAEVRERLWQLGREGGYFCNADQGLDFPKAHAEALQKAIEDYGRYPIQDPRYG